MFTIFNLLEGNKNTWNVENLYQPLISENYVYFKYYICELNASWKTTREFMSMKTWTPLK